MSADQRGEAFGTMRKVGIPDEQLADVFRNIWVPCVKRRFLTHADMLQFIPWLFRGFEPKNFAAFYSVRNPGGYRRLTIGRTDWFKTRPKKQDAMRMDAIINAAVKRAESR